MALEPLDKLLFIYLFSNEKAHSSGVYELPFPVLLLETGMEAGRARQGLATFQKAGRVYYDEESGHCFVRNMMRYNGANLLTNRKVRANLRSFRQTEGASIRYWDLWAQAYPQAAEQVFGRPEKEQKEKEEQEEKKQDASAAGRVSTTGDAAAAAAAATAGNSQAPGLEGALRLLEEARGEASNALDRRRLVEMAARAEAQRLTLGRGAPGADLTGMAWVRQAIEDANTARRPGKPLSLKFVEAVLDRWLDEGYRAPWGGRETAVFEDVEYWEEDL